MFFFIGGIQPRTVIVDRQARFCPRCGRSEVYLKRVDQYLSLFFILLFPVKRGTPFLFCENCNSTLDEQGVRMSFKQAGGKMNCLHCGRQIERDFTFCPYCGKSVNI